MLVQDREGSPSHSSSYTLLPTERFPEVSHQEGSHLSVYQLVWMAVASAPDLERILRTKFGDTDERHRNKNGFQAPLRMFLTRCIIPKLSPRVPEQASVLCPIS